MTNGSPDSITAKDDNALRDAVEWLSTVGGLVVFDKSGEVHVYRGQIHTKAPWDRSAKPSGVEALLAAIRQAREAHEGRG